MFHVPTDTRGFDVVRSLTGDPYVESVTFSIYGERLSVPNDPRWSDQWNLPKINMANTWDITLGDTSVVIAIIDSGADLDHEDLENSLWHGIGFNFVQPHLEPYESWTHGTPVAGIAGAQSNNGLGVAGVAGFRSSTSGTRLMILKDGNNNSDVNIVWTADAIDWAVDNGASVINISSGFPEGWPDLDYLESAVNYAIGHGVAIVAAAGNSGGNTSGNKSVRYPAKYSNIVAVGATLENDTRWVQSDHQGSAVGAELDLMAPGGDAIIWTTSHTGGYTQFGGTSAAAPHVSGVVGLMKSVNPSLSPSQIQSILRSSADWIGHMGGSPPNNEYGYGRLNAYKAVKAALPVSSYGTYGASQYSVHTLHWKEETLLGTTTITIPAGKALVVSDYVYATGPSHSKVVVHGTLILNDGAYWDATRFEIKSGGKMRLEGSNTLASVDIEVESGGLLDVRSGSTISMSNNQNLLSYGKVILEGTTIQNFISTRWGALTLSGSGSAGSRITNSTIKGSVNGLRLVNTNNVEVNTSIVEDHQNVGLYVSGSMDINLIGTTVRNNLSDGFVSDFSSVQIDMFSRFENNGRDGMAVLGSNFISGGDYSVQSALVSKSNTRHGIHAESTTWVQIGYQDIWGPNFGGSNSVYYNGGKQARAATGSYIESQLTWWGTSSPSSSLFEVSGFSTVDWSNWLSTAVVMKAPANDLAQAPESSAEREEEILGEHHRLSHIVREVHLAMVRDGEGALSEFLEHESAEYRYVAGNIHIADLLQKGRFEDARGFIQENRALARNDDDTGYYGRASFWAYVGIGDAGAARLELEGMSDRGRAAYLSTFLGESSQEHEVLETDVQDMTVVNHPNPFNHCHSDRLSVVRVRNGSLGCL